MSWSKRISAGHNSQLLAADECSRGAERLEMGKAMELELRSGGQPPDGGFCIVKNRNRETTIR